MGMVRTASIVALLMAGIANAATTVNLELEVGGDPHTADLKNNVWTLYSAGSTADNQQIQLSNGVVNWAVRAIVSGDHGGFAAKGIANLVCDLELYAGPDDTGSIAGADFYSAYHDAAGSCSDFEPPIDPLIGHCGRDAAGQVNSAENVCTPCFASAAFAFAFSPFGTGARLIDQNIGNNCGTATNPNGGPNMGVFLYPSCEPGKLYGVGAGYPHYKPSGTTTRTRPYIGLYPNADPGMPQSAHALIEGQIDVSGLTPGFYTLKVIPGNGINILRGDINLGAEQPAFALPADNKIGDTITFELVIGTNLELLSAKSRCNHGGTDFDIDLPLSGTPAIEPRVGPQQVVLTFNEPPVAADGSIDAGQEITATTSSEPQPNITNIQVVGNDLVVSLSGLPQWACMIVEATGLETAGGQPMLNATEDVYVNIITGDSNLSGGVTIADQSYIKQQILAPEPLDQSNFTRDVNVSGGVSIADMSAAKGNSGANAVCPVDVD